MSMIYHGTGGTGTGPGTGAGTEGSLPPAANIARYP